MKDCNNCKHMYDAGGECSCYVCELFGEDIPSALEKGDGCCLHPKEVKKAINLRDHHLSWCYRGYGRPLTDQEKRMIEKTSKEYNKYMLHLMEKYMEGRK